jgi:hypothetical protein
MDLVSYAKVDETVIISLCATEGKFPWGTAKQEHRWNPPTITALAEALDKAAADETCCCVVVTGKGKYWSNGMDLKYMDEHSANENGLLGKLVDSLMAKVLCFKVPTIAAINGHFCAAGGMMGLCFDYRVMNSDKGFFFVPGVDLGIVYSPFQTAMMLAKLPVSPIALQMLNAHLKDLGHYICLSRPPCTKMSSFTTAEDGMLQIYWRRVWSSRRHLPPRSWTGQWHLRQTLNPRGRAQQGRRWARSSSWCISRY